MVQHMVNFGSVLWLLEENVYFAYIGDWDLCNSINYVFRTFLC